MRGFGIADPDEEWGDYVLLRPWDEQRFLASLRSAERQPASKLKRDGNRAVIYCSTTDPYQVIHHPVPTRQRELSDAVRHLVRRSLELIRDHSTLNVRILTRSPLARQDFDIFRSFGDRLLFGMSIPTLRNDLARIYEPRAPSPAQRIATLRAAKKVGLHVFSAMAPTYPECDEDDIRQTLKTVAEIGPLTVFHEPINIRGENVVRIKKTAQSLGISLKTEVFENPSAWRKYAIGSLKTVERISNEVGLSDHLHLWPDKALGSKAALSEIEEPIEHTAWLQKWWSRVSEWPTR